MLKEPKHYNFTNVFSSFRFIKRNNWMSTWVSAFVVTKQYHYFCTFLIVRIFLNKTIDIQLKERWSNDPILISKSPTNDSNFKKNHESFVIMKFFWSCTFKKWFSFLNAAFWRLSSSIICSFFALFFSKEFFSLILLRRQECA